MTKAQAFTSPVGVARGINKGFVVTKKAAPVTKAGKAIKAPISLKGKKSKYTTVVRSVIRDTAGFSAYERRMMEVLKGGGNNPQKRALKYAKQRLGTQLRAKKKLAEMDAAITRATGKK